VASERCFAVRGALAIIAEGREIPATPWERRENWVIGAE